MPPEGPEKVRESLIRRMANRQGYTLQRIRRYDPLATGFGMYRLWRNATEWPTEGKPKPPAVLGEGDVGVTLDAVEHWLNHPESRKA